MVYPFEYICMVYPKNTIHIPYIYHTYVRHLHMYGIYHTYTIHIPKIGVPDVYDIAFLDIRYRIYDIVCFYDIVCQHAISYV